MRRASRRTVVAAAVGGLGAGALGGCGVFDGDPAAVPSGPRDDGAGPTAAIDSAAAPLPDLVLDGFDGSAPLDLAALRGPAVITLWASWCAPCRDELPVVERFHQRHGDRVQVVGVDYQDVQVDAARALARDSGITFRLAADPDGTLSGAAPFPLLRGLPFWAWVDGRGRVVHQQFVEMTSVRQLRDQVRSRLGIAL